MIAKKDLWYLGQCVIGAQYFSTCAKRQYMAYVLSATGRVIGTGYNGSPPGEPHCIDGFCPRMQEGSPSGSSYDNCISVHAEQNALLWSDRTAREGGTLYVNGPPCSTCAKLIAGSGLKRLVHVEDLGYTQWPEIQAGLEHAGISVENVDYMDVILEMSSKAGYIKNVN